MSVDKTPKEQDDEDRVEARRQLVLRRLDWFVEMRNEDTGADLLKALDDYVEDRLVMAIKRILVLEKQQDG